jgi:glycosyltransferase involved in cell wall biosynthesis
MRILYYNWVDYLDDEARGGGVSVYQRNLMAAMSGQAGTEATFLSSGISYDLRRSAPRWEQLRHGPEQERDRRYEIVNSGVLSPAHHAFGNPAQLSHAATRDAVFDFIAQTGPYDVIHFNNLEGLPVDVLDLRARWPRTRVVLSLHNYYPICPQVNLWHQERAACADFKDGAACADCLLHKPDERLVRLANGLAYHLKCAGFRPGTRGFDVLFGTALRLGHRGSRLLGALRRRARTPSGAGPAATGFADRRARMIAAINGNCDLVLCVSDRVRGIAERYGVDPALLRTSYIGTAEAEAFAHTCPAAQILGADQTLTLGYLGYMRRDKGFFFLLDALEALPDDLAARLRLVVAARGGPGEAMMRLEALRGRLAGLTWLDGYSHDGLDELLEDVDLGVIPVLWEDNLPQVAVEMHARHIPLLTSDLGGAQELASCSEMVFAAGDVAAFGDRIRALLAGEVTMESYWRRARVPPTMALHLDELNRLYREDSEGMLSATVP